MVFSARQFYPPITCLGTFLLPNLNHIAIPHKMLGLTGYASSDEDDDTQEDVANVSAQWKCHKKNEITTNIQDIQAQLDSKGAVNDGNIKSGN